MDNRFTDTIAAGESLTAAQFHAIALDDGKLAANGKEAGGILLNKPASGEHASLNVMGVSRYAAGAAVAAGARLTATASGWLVTASSGTYIVGRNLDAAVTSGSIGRGVFNFHGDYSSTSFE